MLRRVKFRTKLIVGFAAMLTLLLVFAFIVLRMYFDMNQAMHAIVNDHYSNVKLANAVRADITSLNAETNALLLMNRSNTRQERVESIQRTKQDLDANMDELMWAFEQRAEKLQLVQDLHELHDSFVNSTDAAVALLRDNDKAGAIAWYNENTEPIRLELFDTLNQFTDLQEQEMDKALSQSNGDYDLAIRLMIALIAFTLLVGVIVAAWVLRSVLRNLGRIIAVMKEAALAERGERLPRIDMRIKDEMASIGDAYNVMAGALEEHAEFQKQANLQLQEQNWHKTKVAEITARYQGIVSLNELARVFITAVCPAIGAAYGAFYLRVDPEEGGTPRLVRGGAYAADNRIAGADGFAFGEGLAGQCAAENRLMTITNPPDNYIRISSGLGTASPEQIVIVPVEHQGQVVAVVELATFHVFTRTHVQLLEELASLLGITIHSVTGHMKIQQLLGESQIFTEELQTQSEELQLQQEELKTLNEQLRDQIEASEKKSRELELIRHELEDKNEQILLASGYKTEFLTNMSHELRTPLNSLLILSQMLAANPDGTLSPKQVEYAQTIHSSGKDLLGLINEVLDLSKVEAGKLEVVFDWVRLKDIAEFVRRQFEPIAMDKSLDFEVKMDDELSEMKIHTDEQRLQQILQNLMANALKFTDRGSVSMEMGIRPDPSGAGADAGPRGDYALAIAVSDTGIGIPKDKQAVIFEAFRQADGTTSRKYGGTGLGLSICQKIAQLLDGYIQVESEEGAGSTFTLYLPISKVRSELLAGSADEAAAACHDWTEPETPPDAASGLPDVSLEGKTVLLVDDDLRNIYALTTALETHRLHVLFAENGQEALQLLDEQDEIDLVIMDIMMPKMDGYEAIRAIRKRPEFADLPIIALTAKAMKYDRDKCIDAGANDYISKPILLDQLLSLIRVWLYR